MQKARGELEQGTINTTMKKWRTRLKECVAASGGYFEHKFKTAKCRLIFRQHLIQIAQQSDAF